MDHESFVSRNFGVDPDFVVNFTEDERQEIEAIAGANLAPKVFEELRAMAFHAQLRRSLTLENEDIGRVRRKFKGVEAAAQRLFEELSDDDGEFGGAAHTLLGFGRKVVTDESTGEATIYDDVQAKAEFDAFVAVVERIRRVSTGISVNYGMSERGHNASDGLKKYVVDGVIDLYRNLLAREVPSAGGNPSGPAARFLLAAANPLLRPIERALPTLSAARQQLARRSDVHK